MNYGSTDAPAKVAKSPDGSSPSSPIGADTSLAHSQESVSSASVTQVDESESKEGWRRTLGQKLNSFYERNFGLFLVFLAQMFGSIMSMATRLLETGFETKFHALQVIFVRMLTTGVLGSLYMWYKQVPDFPFGERSVRRLLVLRGMAGFTGLFGLYYALSYLELSEATIITFLVPTLTAFVCFVVLREPFTVKEAMAGVIAFAGVIFIARPTFLFPDAEAGPLHPDSPHSKGTSVFAMDKGLVPSVPATPAERALAVTCAVAGTFASATAYATIRLIGKRTHSLVSVNYFAILATVGSFLILIIHPDLHFETPQNAAQWILLVTIGVAGFLLQFLLTEGLQREKAGRATNLIYTQLVFALIIERVVWGTTPPVESLFGGALIIAAALWVSLQKNQTPPAVPQNQQVVDEESSLLGSAGEDTNRRV
ncbi:uncharacterized protein BCR38DRAFT_450571 [Pseudomassariella vexata]|uniref:EamA domain-containing protein n=1 Tax=Pseudomassariella vexata TaxID=1141098 RepID=A0A1Y2DCL6_9PEZI|nr:uncharacterized protein BCR38DRAFT_450571 [Pseudomassariella vexata]ORY57011.1 hypothetical protein BCR38DRAFT_450571 [Pseudomassariella vexata]